ncbi:TonB-dependent receptor [Haliscomenobacter hydrossis]|uniref:TonB-dependent receptor n=1 Tax=Haliscomenobacter hydrossis (strain ATCC 27775 / DSM 1100 / LMG 10767 / O) TaxID=760192 RepID=F4KYP2_HALH1|nr:TonB-dependent receptor [Haliscomenobacter hydrossis]AEE50448.1 TonB-dependent receptor [Haliscomenobacter hydrossis DSM 1100]
MKKQLTTVLWAAALLLLCGNAAAQTIASSIKGRVLSAEGQALEYANVLLQKAADSSIVKLEYTLADGSFLIANLEPGQYRLAVSFVGYPNFLSQIHDVQAGQTLSVAEIKLQPVANELQGVTVKAQKPLLEIRPDKTIFNVEGSITASGSNAFDLLRKSPGVVIDNNDNITMLGRAGIRIYIDGRPSPMQGADLAQFLRNLQSNEIEAIELITNPSAKYDAQGNAGIINIRLKKDKKLGANGNVNLGYSVGEKAWYNGGVSANYRNKKTNVFGSYNYSDNEFLNFMTIDRSQLGSRFDQINEQNSVTQNHNFKVGADWTLNQKETIGVLASGFLGNNNYHGDGRTVISRVGQTAIDSILIAQSDNAGLRNNLNFNLNYRFDNGKGKSLNLDADYGMFRNTGEEFQPNYYYDALEKVKLSERIFASSTPTDIDIYTFKADFENKLWGGQLGAGIKATYVRTDNTFDFFNVLDNVKVLNTDLSNQFVYTENVNAAYVSYSRQLKKWGFNAGLRAEQTNSEGDLEAYKPVNDDNVQRHYLDFFPSGGITYNLSPKNTFALNYSRRVNRPSYQDLNPFQNRLDELTYEQGNPFLRPEYANNLQLRHTFNHRFNTTLSYSHTQDQITRFLDTAGTSANYITWLNLANQYAYSLAFSAPIQIRKWWGSFTNMTGSHVRNQADFGEGKTVALAATTFNIYSQHTFTLPKGWSAEVSGWYNAPSLWGGTFKMNAMWSMDMGIQKKIMEGKGNIKLGVGDVFRSNKWAGTSRFGALNLDITGGWDSRRLKLNFTYNLGNDQVKAARRRSTGLEDEQKRVKSE